MTFCCIALACAAETAPPSAATATLNHEQSRIEDFGANLHVELTLSQPVPWRVYTLDEPRRLVLDFANVAFDEPGLAAILDSDAVADMRCGEAEDGWSRLVLELDGPMKIETAGLSAIGPGAILKLQLAPTTARDFAARSGVPETTRLEPPTRRSRIAAASR